MVFGACQSQKRGGARLNRYRGFVGSRMDRSGLKPPGLHELGSPGCAAPVCAPEWQFARSSGWSAAAFSGQATGCPRTVHKESLQARGTKDIGAVNSFGDLTGNE